jgi:hypothetical protein
MCKLNLTFFMLARDRSSLEFTTTIALMKGFRTGSAAVITECQRYFNFLPMQLQLTIRTARFLNVFVASQSHICLLFESVATRQLNSIFSNYCVKTIGQLRSKILDQFMQPVVN